MISEHSQYDFGDGWDWDVEDIHDRTGSWLAVTFTSGDNDVTVRFPLRDGVMVTDAFAALTDELRNVLIESGGPFISSRLTRIGVGA